MLVTQRSLRSCPQPLWKRQRRQGSNKGYALFDVLLGSFFLAVALLLVAYSSQHQQQSSDNAWYGQHALVIAEDIASRIRINANSATSYGSDYTSNSLWTSNRAVCQTCSPKQQIRQDAFEIRQMLDRLLPEATAQVKHCGQSLCIYILWSNGSTEGNQCSHNCVRLVIRA